MFSFLCVSSFMDVLPKWWELYIEGSVCLSVVVAVVVADVDLWKQLSRKQPDSFESNQHLQWEHMYCWLWAYTLMLDYY